MKPRGSITIYFALTFAVMAALITACIFSAKVEAGRARTANAADQAIYSLFARYDHPLFKTYDLFFVDGSCGSARMDMGSCIQFLSDSSDYLLNPQKDRPLSGAAPLLNLKRTACSITGYTLATDLNNMPYLTQAIEAEKSELGAAAIGHLMQAGRPQNVAASLTNQPAPAVPSPQSGDAGVTVPADFVNPLPLLQALKQRSLLPLVVGSDRPVSDQTTASLSSPLLSGRTPESGFGLMRAAKGSLSPTDRLIFSQYLLDHFSSYTNQTNSGPLSYEVEYIIGKSGSDRVNLESTVKKLLVMREAINILYLEGNPEKHEELTNEALLIATSLGAPETEPAVQVLLAAAWSFAESLVDLRAVLHGKKTARLKTPETWQTDLSDLSHLTEGMDGLTIDAPGGQSYQDLLRLLLISKKQASLAVRSMDMIEANLKTSRPLFQLDHCFDSLSFELTVRSEGKITLTAERSFSYRSKEASNAR